MTLLKEAAKLPLSDRIKLVEDIWDSIADDADHLPLTKEQELELDRRLALMKKKSRTGDSVGGRQKTDFETALVRQMKQRFTIQPQAEAGANDAFNWYEDQQSGLGNEFYRELTRCFEFILENPLLSRVAYRGLRKRKLDRFPYLIVYQVTEDELSSYRYFTAAEIP